MTYPKEEVLLMAFSELRENHSFKVFERWLLAERETLVQAALNPHFSEKLGMMNRSQGNIEAFDAVLSRIGIVNKNLDIINNSVPDAAADEAGGSGLSH